MGPTRTRTAALAGNRVEVRGEASNDHEDYENCQMVYVNDTGDFEDLDRRPKASRPETRQTQNARPFPAPPTTVP